MTKGSIGYSAKSGSPKSTGVYGLGNDVKSINGYGLNQKGSGGMYMVIGIGYTGNSKEMAQGLQQYLSVLGQYLSNMLGDDGNKLQRYDDIKSAKGFYKPFGSKGNMGLNLCEICGAPTPDGIRRCPVCSLV